LRNTRTSTQAADNIITIIVFPFACAVVRFVALLSLSSSSFSLLIFSPTLAGPFTPRLWPLPRVSSAPASARYLTGGGVRILIAIHNQRRRAMTTTTTSHPPRPRYHHSFPSAKRFGAPARFSRHRSGSFRVRLITVTPLRAAFCPRLSGPNPERQRSLTILCTRQ